MANLTYLLLLLQLSTLALSQNASTVSSSSSDTTSSTSSLSVGSSSTTSSLSSTVSSQSSVTSSSSSITSSTSSVAPSTSSSTSRRQGSEWCDKQRPRAILTATETPSSEASTSSSSSSSSSRTSTSSSESYESATTASRSSSLVASTSESSVTSTTGTSSSSAVTSSSIESSSSPTSFFTSTSISFSSSTVTSIVVIPATSNGAIGYSTLTTYIVSSAPVATDISTYTSSELPASNPTTQAGADNSGGGGGLTSGAKIGIGVGIGLAVLAAALFGGWYSWYMRRRRRRSISASDRYPPSSIPSMLGMGGAYNEKSDTRSELPSPPIGGPIGGGHVSPPPRSPDRLLPPGPGVRSWNSVSNSNVPASNQSVSDYSERGGQPPPEPGELEEPGGYYAAGGAVHEMPENQRQYQYQQQHPQQQFAHSRTVSGESHPSELGDSTLRSQHQRTLSGGSQHYQQPSMGGDGYWHDTQNAHELQGSPGHLQQTQSRGEGYRGVDPEVPLHQRMQNERIPVRPGHLQKSPPTLPPSHNF